ncbi:uncharacterized protein [Prorops nasuta]|uniref:uncharacterized protein n=1 Tax=Prorops nasuta TaxID=863751 RepID=UPI0034CFB175
MSKEKVQLVKELHRSARKNFPRRRVIIKGYDDLWQADLVDMRAYTHQNKVENQKIYRLTMVKCYNKTFQDLMKKHTINHYSTYSIMKASIVKRFTRTLKNDMWKLFTMNGSYKWINILITIINDYNRRKHRTTGMKPIDINAKNSTHLLNTVYSNIKIAAPRKFKVGDFVRLSKYKMLFEKGYTPNWTTEVFKVKVIQKTNPVSYLLQDLSNNDIKGAFYEQELSEVKDKNLYLVEKILRKKGNKVFVKWLGFEKSNNSWIDKDNVL